VDTQHKRIIVPKVSADGATDTNGGAKHARLDFKSMAVDSEKQKQQHQTRPLSDTVGSSPLSKHEHRHRERDKDPSRRTSSGGESHLGSGHDARRTEHNSSTHKHPPRERPLSSSTAIQSAAEMQAMLMSSMRVDKDKSHRSSGSSGSSSRHHEKEKHKTPPTSSSVTSNGQRRRTSADEDMDISDGDNDQVTINKQPSTTVKEKTVKQPTGDLEEGELSD